MALSVCKQSLETEITHSQFNTDAALCKENPQRRPARCQPGTGTPALKACRRNTHGQLGKENKHYSHFIFQNVWIKSLKDVKMAEVLSTKRYMSRIGMAAKQRQYLTSRNFEPRLCYAVAAAYKAFPKTSKKKMRIAVKILRDQKRRAHRELQELKTAREKRRKKVVTLVDIAIKERKVRFGGRLAKINGHLIDVIRRPSKWGTTIVRPHRGFRWSQRPPFELLPMLPSVEMYDKWERQKAAKRAKDAKKAKDDAEKSEKAGSYVIYGKRVEIKKVKKEKRVPCETWFEHKHEVELQNPRHGTSFVYNVEKIRTPAYN